MQYINVTRLTVLFIIPTKLVKSDWMWGCVNHINRWNRSGDMWIVFEISLVQHSSI